MDMNLIHLLLLFLVAAVYMAVGRMVFTHTCATPLYASPLNCFVLGVAVWFLWFLVFHGVLGVSLGVVWYTFLVSALALSIVLTRILNAPHENPLFWPKIVVGVLLALPAFWVLRGDGPMLWGELGHLLKNTAHMLDFAGLPPPAKAEAMGITGILSQVAVPLLSLPVMVMAENFLPAVPTHFALLIYILAGAELVRQCQVHVRPQNLVAFSVVGLVGISLLNPFFIESLALSAYPDTLLAAVLFTLALPLMDRHPLPSGLGLLPYGLLLALLPGLTPLVVALAGVFVLAYFFLLLRDKGLQTSPIRGAMGLLLMGLMPALAVAGLGYAAHRLGLSFWTGDVFTGSVAPVPGLVAGVQAFLAAALSGPGMGMVVLLLLFMAGLRAIKMRFGESLDTIFAHKRQVMVPVLLLAVYPIVLGGMYLIGFADGAAPFTQGGLHYLLHLQFVLLLPLWVWVHNAYRTLIPPQSNAVSGGASFIMALLFVVFLAVNSNAIRQPPFPGLSHTLKAADAMKAGEGDVAWAAKVAVLDGAATKGYYANALAYGLKGYAYVRPVLQTFADAAGRFDAFHDSLLAGEYEYLWVHAITPDIALVMGDNMRPDASYLYKVTPDGLTPVKSYSHAGYTYEQAAYVPRY